MAQPERTGVETDERGWIKVDAFLQTTEPTIWPLTDAMGWYVFRHTANYDAEMVGLNGFADDRHQVGCHAVPHAVYGCPQVGVVGLVGAAGQGSPLRDPRGQGALHGRHQRIRHR